jgi:hypothetical protein
LRIKVQKFRGGVDSVCRPDLSAVIVTCSWFPWDLQYLSYWVEYMSLICTASEHVHIPDMYMKENRSLTIYL